MYLKFIYRGWIIVFVSFLINMIADGITFSFGVFNVEFLKYFGDSKGKTAWISSIFMAVPLLSGPIASYLTDRYGCRKVTIVGSITAAIGFLLSACSKSMEMLFITFGIISGFGLSLCYVAAVVIVAYYFDKKRSFATGISVCGSGVGTFFFPPIIQYLITHYGWRGCTVLLAGVLLNMCVCGALMKVSRAVNLIESDKMQSINFSRISSGPHIMPNKNGNTRRKRRKTETLPTIRFQ
jgi:MFS family permease